MKFTSTQGETAPKSRTGLRVLIFLVLALTSVYLVPKLISPPPSVAIPLDFDTLEPQLQAYLKEQITLVEETPRSSNQHATLGTIYAVNGLWNEALQQFQNARLLDPNSPLAHLYHAVALQETGETERGLEGLAQVCQTFPAFPQGFSRYGQGALKVGQLEAAAQAFERLILLAPNEWRGHVGLGNVRLQEGNPEAAEPHLKRGLELDPSVQIAHHLLGLVYQRTGRTSAAEQELKLGAGAVYYPMPDTWSITAPEHFRRLQDQFATANDYIDVGRPDLALPILLRAAAWHPDDKSLLINLARTYMNLGETQQTKATVDKILALDPDDLSALVLSADNYLDLGQPDTAESYARKAIQIAPESPQAHLALATVMINSNRPEAALEAYREAQSRDPQNALIAMEMGDVQIRQLNRPEDALATYESAAALDPSLFLVQIRIADVHLRQKRSEPARAALERARSLNPNDPVLTVLQQRLDQLQRQLQPPPAETAP